VLLDREHLSWLRAPVETYLRSGKPERRKVANGHGPEPTGFQRNPSRKARRATQGDSDAVAADDEVIRQLMPETYTVSDIRNINQLATSRNMCAACPAFGNRTVGPAFCHHSRELDIGSDRGLFTTDPIGLPVYEGRMIDHFGHRAKTYQSGHGNSGVWIKATGRICPDRRASRTPVDLHVR